ncbi:FERM and PDZ domain-containing protein 1 [Gouania willdenowi]|uniref:FERM and PDZ domain-containing protein 1 n=1 Tax=Gouania willdenowi TaxID=441366 RepID=UPI0010557DB6|nr:FERM and PDZ domain-containing protein 1-like [Gouania willdenowi]XP_028323793.1 FERM and PDZ domain-containing protein 1-like [Gouania willdenowi]
MEAQDRSRSPSRRTSRVEQVVGRWLRRSRDLGSRSHSLSRDRTAADGRTADSSGSDQRNYSFRFNLQIHRDPKVDSHGLTLSSQTPILVQDVTPGGPADGRLVPGDQLVKINNVAVDDLTPEQAAEIIRECQDTLTMTVLRTMLGPKSSFITPEKRAKLRSNPVKVHFAEEVEVNGHSQGNSLLFLPNVLKVYLENGQTKAFKFEPSTTVKDIVMTLKEKLSLSHIEYFSLVLEQRHSISKLLLLHDEEPIQQVVQKKEAHDYKCLFRVCFMPKNLQVLLQDDSTAFEYLYLQGVNDVLQERFAVEMRCNTALRLAALHIQERLASCGLSPKTNLKTVTKTWGIENFVSSTLLRNMREKDLRKAIGYHMKRSQSQQKRLPVDQARINYLEELSELKSFGGKSFGATLMLQDRESMVTLLVGARYGVSQVINHKLSILSTLTEFSCITRIELLPESEKVSLVKIYLQDIKPITLLLESVAAKDMSCLIAGYCRVFVDPNLNIFPWFNDSKKHKVSAEEGYVSRCASDSDDFSDMDMEPLVKLVSNDNKPRARIRSSSDPEGKKRRVRRRSSDGKEKEDKTQKDNEDTEKERQEGDGRIADAEQIKIQITDGGSIKPVGEEDWSRGGDGVEATEDHPSLSEISDSCQTDSRVLTSPSSDSLDALEEDDLLSCSSSSVLPKSVHHCSIKLHPFPQSHAQPHLLTPPPAHCHPLINLADLQLLDRSPSENLHRCSGDLCSEENSLCFAELSRLANFLPSPPEASEEDDEEDELWRRRKLLEDMEKIRIASEAIEGGSKEHPLTLSPLSGSAALDFVFNFDQSDARCYYNICSNITPDSARSLPIQPDRKEEKEAEVVEPVPILEPPPGFGDSSSDDEFFDARDRFTSPEDPTSLEKPRGVSTKMNLNLLSTLSLSDIQVSVVEANKDREEQEYRREDKRLLMLRKDSRKRRSFVETNYTSKVSYPEPEASTRTCKNLLVEANNIQKLSSDPKPSEKTENPSPTWSSLTQSEGEPTQLESKPILSRLSLQGPDSTQSQAKKQDMEMEPDSMESKSVTELMKTVSPSITVVRWRVDPDGKESADRRGDGKEEVSLQLVMSEQREKDKLVVSGPLMGHLFVEGNTEEANIEDKGLHSSSLNQLTFSCHRSPETNIQPNSLTEKNQISSNGILIFPGGEYTPEEVFEKSPPPPPPSSPLPLLPVSQKFLTDSFTKEKEEGGGTKFAENSSCDPHSTEMNDLTNKAQSLAVITTSKNDPSVTLSDEITDSTNSDNVFYDEDDDEAIPPLNLGPSNKSLGTKFDIDNDENGTIIQSLSNSEPHTRGRLLNSDHSHTKNSVTSKHGAAKRVTSSFDAGSGPKAEVALRNTSDQKSDCTSENPENDKNVTNPVLMNVCTSPTPDLSKQPPMTAHFLFQTLSPSVMGRLSASTLRGKIQKLPLYMSRSQETLNEAGVEIVIQSPSEDEKKDGTKIAVKLTDVHDVTETVEVESGAAAESVDSEDSDSTITGSEVDGEFFTEKTAPSETEAKENRTPSPVQSEPNLKLPNQLFYSEPMKVTPGPITEPPTSIISHLLRDTTDTQLNMPGPMQDATQPNVKALNPDQDTPGYKINILSPTIPAPVVVTTQNLNGPGISFHSQAQKLAKTSSDRPLMGLCQPADQNANASQALSSGCRVFTICDQPSQTKVLSEVAVLPPLKSELSCSSLLASGCESIIEGVQVPLDACGCPAVYTNCFGGGDNFDEELTVYEFSCRTQSSGVTKTTGANLPLVNSSPMPSFFSATSTYSPSFPRSILFSTSTSELSPLLSPLSNTPDSLILQTHKEMIRHLCQHHYPEPPAGFQMLRVDVDRLLSVLESSGADRSVTSRHPRDTCPAHFTENKRVLQMEARRLMAGCQQVVGVGQSPEEMLQSLSDSFRTLVELAGICLWFSGCDRCDRRNAEAVTGLSDVARSFRDFCLAAERASSKRSCQDLSSKLLAKQCTALTASVFCLTQLFRTLTAL